METKLEKEVNLIKESDGLFFFGTGSLATYLYKFWAKSGLKIIGFIDNNPGKQGTFFWGLPVISINDYLKLQNKPWIFICSSYYKEIEEQLDKLKIDNYSSMTGFKHVQLRYLLDNQNILFSEFYNKNKHLLDQTSDYFNDQESKLVYNSVINYRLTGNPEVLKVSSYSQYFHPIVKIADGGCFIDGGAYIGDTLDRLKEHNIKEINVYCFEPSKSNFKHLESNTKNFPEFEVTPVEAALGADTTKMFMNTHDDETSDSYTVGNEGNEEIMVFSLDDFVKKNNIQKIDTIKLDVEGFELEALNGAVDTIERDYPKLQVCLYHKYEDLFEIPKYIKGKYPLYNFYLGHHSESSIETVLYCIKEQ